MDTAETMRLETVTLKNFRNFEDLTIKLDPHLTVFIGENGAGKTALLDGIATALTPVLTHLSSANQRLSGRGFKDADFRLEKSFGRGGKLLWSKADYAQVQIQTTAGIRWDYWKPSGNFKGAEPLEKWGETQLKDHLATIYTSYKTQHPLSTPVFAYYGANRGIQVPERLREAKLNYAHPTAALYGCLDPSSDFREMLEWFDLEESSELRENKGQREEDFIPFGSLNAVRAAVMSLLGDFCNPHFNSAHKFMLTRKNDGAPMLVEQLSQGYQSMLAIAMDFARRLAVANPHLEYGTQHSPLNAPAIMLIDELDVHLHPSWQQRVLTDLRHTFPNTQFIVTTHSPQILSTVPRQNIRILTNNATELPLAATYGQPSGDVMHSVMLVDPQPPIPEKSKLDQLTELVDTGRYDTLRVRRLLAVLKKRLGQHHPQLLTLQRNIRRMQALSA